MKYLARKREEEKDTTCSAGKAVLGHALPLLTRERNGEKERRGAERGERNRRGRRSNEEKERKIGKVLLESYLIATSNM